MFSLEAFFRFLFGIESTVPFDVCFINLNFYSGKRFCDFKPDCQRRGKQNFIFGSKSCKEIIQTQQQIVLSNPFTVNIRLANSLLFV